MAIPKVPRNCANCGAEFLQHWCVIKRGGHSGEYCSTGCYQAARRVPKIEKACLECGVAIFITASRMKRGDGKFCGLACRRVSRRVAIENRFWNKVDKTPGQGPEGTCWTWKAGTNPHGYGSIRAGKEQRAHRVSYILTNGDIPETLCVLHRCDNPPCVRPDHLFLGTQIDNIRDMVSKNRQRRG